MNVKELIGQLNSADIEKNRWRVSRYGEFYVITHKGYQKSICVVDIPKDINSISSNVKIKKPDKLSDSQLVSILHFAKTSQIYREPLFIDPNLDEYLSENSKNLYNLFLISTSPKNRKNLTVSFNQLYALGTINGRGIKPLFDLTTFEESLVELSDRNYIEVDWSSFKSNNDFSISLSNERG